MRSASTRRATRTAACAAVLMAALGATGCATNPVTGKAELALMSEAQELALGRQAAAEIAKQYRVYDDPRLAAYVERIGQALAAHSHRPNLLYRFTVLDSPDVNAFALPGGYIYVERGLLAYLDSEAELAAVLGHEIGHVAARHAVRQYSAAQVASLGATLGAIFVPQLRTQAATQVINVLGTALLRGYGREMELEADRLGAEYAARAGYDPMAELGVLRKLKALEQFEVARAKAEGREPRVYHGLFATHPDHDTRLHEVLEAAGGLMPPGPPRVGRDAYLAMIEGLVFGDSPEEGFVRDGTFIHPKLGFALRFPPGWRVHNQPDRIVAVAPGGAALVEVRAEQRNLRIPPREFMTRRLGLDDLTAEAPLRPHGLEGWSAVTVIDTPFGRRQARVNVVYLGGWAFVVLGVARDAGALRRWDHSIVDVAKSLRPLEGEERAAKPLRIHVVTVQQPVDFERLARQAGLGPDGPAVLRLLNGLYPDGEPQKGQKIKVLR